MGYFMYVMGELELLMVGDEAEGTPTLRLHARHYAWMQAAA